MNPRVKSVTATDDYKLEITFTNGEVGMFDCSPLLGFGVFEEFRDLHYFKRAFVEGGTVVWPHEQDICPDTLYEDSTKVVPGSVSKDNRLVPPNGRAIAEQAIEPKLILPTRGAEK